MSAPKNQSQSIFLQKFSESGAINHVEAHFLSLVVESLNSKSQTDLLSVPAELSIDPLTYLSMDLPPSNFSALAAFNIVFKFLESHQLHYTLNSLQNELTNSTFLTKNSNLNVTNKLKLNSHKSIIKQLISKRDQDINNQKIDDLSKNAKIRAQVAQKLLTLADSGKCPAINTTDVRNHLINTISNTQNSRSASINNSANDLQISSSLHTIGISSSAVEKEKEAIIQLQNTNSYNKKKYFDSYSYNNTMDIDSNDLQVSSGLPPAGISSSAWEKQMDAVLQFQNNDNFDSNANDSLDLSELLPHGLTNKKWHEDISKSVNKLNTSVKANDLSDSLKSQKNTSYSTEEVPFLINLANSKSKGVDEITEIDSNINDDQIPNTQTISSVSIDLSNIMPNEESSDEWKRKREEAVHDTMIRGENFIPIPHKFSSSSTSKANSVCSNSSKAKISSGESNKTDTSSIIPSNYSPSKWQKLKLEKIRNDSEPSISSTVSNSVKSTAPSYSNSTKLSQLSLNEVNIEKETKKAINETDKTSKYKRKKRYSSPTSSVHSASTLSRDENKSQLEQLKELQKAIDYSDSNLQSNSYSNLQSNSDLDLQSKSNPNLLSKGSSSLQSKSSSKSSNLQSSSSPNLPSKLSTNSSLRSPPNPNLPSNSGSTSSSSSSSFNFNEQFSKMNLSESEESSEPKAKSGNLLSQSQSTDSDYSKKMPKAPTLVESSEYERIRQELIKKVNKPNEIDGFINTNLSENSEEEEEEKTENNDGVQIEIKAIKVENNKPKPIKKKKIIKKRQIEKKPQQINNNKEEEELTELIENNSATLSSDEIKSYTNTAERNSLTSGKSYTTNLNTSTISANNAKENESNELLDEDEDVEDGDELTELVEDLNKTPNNNSNLNSTNENNNSSSFGGFQFTPKPVKTRNANMKPVVVATSSSSSSSSSSHKLKNVILASSSSSSSSYDSGTKKEAANGNGSNTQEEEVFQILQDNANGKDENFDLKIGGSNAGFELPQNSQITTFDGDSSSSEENDGFYLSPTSHAKKLTILPNKPQPNKIEYVSEGTTTDRAAILQIPSENEIVQINNPIVKKSDSTTQTDITVTTPKKRIIKVKKRKNKTESTKQQNILSGSSDSSEAEDPNDVYLPGVNYEKKDQNNKDNSPLNSPSSSNTPTKKREAKVMNFEELIKTIPDVPETRKVTTSNNESIIIDKLLTIGDDEEEQENTKVYNLNNDKNTNIIAFEFPDNSANNTDNVVAFEFPENQNFEEENEEEEEEKTEIHLDDDSSFQSSLKYLPESKKESGPPSPKKTPKRIKVIKKIIKKSAPKTPPPSPLKSSSSNEVKSDTNSPQKRIIKKVKKVSKTPPGSPKSSTSEKRELLNPILKNVDEAPQPPSPSLKKKRRKISQNKSKDAENEAKPSNEEALIPSDNQANDVEKAEQKQKTKRKDEKEDEKAKQKSRKRELEDEKVDQKARSVDDEEKAESSLSPKTLHSKEKQINSQHSDSSDSEHDIEKDDSKPSKEKAVKRKSPSTSPIKKIRKVANVENAAKIKQNEASKTPEIERIRNRFSTPTSTPSKGPKIQFVSPRVAAILGNADSVIVSDDDDDLKNVKPAHLNRNMNSKPNGMKGDENRNQAANENEKGNESIIDSTESESNNNNKEEEENDDEDNIESENNEGNKAGNKTIADNGDETIDDEEDEKQESKESEKQPESESSTEEDSHEDLFIKRFEPPATSKTTTTTTARSIKQRRKKLNNISDIIERYELEEAEKKEREEKNKPQNNQQDQEKGDNEEVKYQLINNYRFYTNIDQVCCSSDSTFSQIEATVRKEANSPAKSGNENQNQNQIPEVFEEEEEEFNVENERCSQQVQTEIETQQNEEEISKPSNENEEETNEPNNENEEEEEDRVSNNNRDDNSLKNENYAKRSSNSNNNNGHRYADLDIQEEEEEEEINEISSIICELPQDEEQKGNNSNNSDAEDSTMNQSLLNIFRRKDKDELKQEKAVINLPSKEELENSSKEEEESEDQSNYVALSPRNPLRKKIEFPNFNLNPSSQQQQQQQQPKDREVSVSTETTESEKVECSDYIPLSPINPTNRSLTKAAFQPNEAPEQYESSSASADNDDINENQNGRAHSKAEQEAAAAENQKEDEDANNEPYEYVYLTGAYRNTGNDRQSLSSSSSSSRSRKPQINKKKVLTFDDVMERIANKAKSDKRAVEIEDFEEIESSQNNKSSLQINNVPISESSNITNAKENSKFDSNTVEGILNVSSIRRAELNEEKNPSEQDEKSDSTIDSSSTQNNNIQDNQQEIVEEEEEQNENQNSSGFASSSELSLFSEEFDKIKNLPISSKHRSGAVNNNKKISDTSFISTISCGESEFNYKEDDFPIIKKQKEQPISAQKNDEIEEISSFFAVENEKSENKKMNNSRVRFDSSILQNEGDNNNNTNNSSSSLFSTEFKNAQTSPFKISNNENQPQQQNQQQIGNENENEEEEEENVENIENQMPAKNDNQKPANTGNNFNDSSSFFSVEYDKIKDKKVRRNQQKQNDENNQIGNIEENESLNKNSSSLFSVEFDKIKDKRIRRNQEKQPTENEINADSINKKVESKEKEKSDAMNDSSFFTDEFEKVEQKKQSLNQNDSSNFSSIPKDEANNNNRQNHSKSILVSDIDIDSNSENKEETPAANAANNNHYKYSNNNSNNRNNKSFIDSSSFFATLSDDFNKPPPSKFIKKKGSLNNSSSDLISEITDGVSDFSDEDKNRKMPKVPANKNTIHNESKSSTFSDAFNDRNATNNNYNSKFISNRNNDNKDQSSSIIDSVSIHSDQQPIEKVKQNTNSTFSEAFNDRNATNNSIDSKFVSPKNNKDQSSSIIDSVSIHSEQQPIEKVKQNTNSTFSDALESDSRSPNNSQKFIKKNKNSQNESSVISSISGGHSSFLPSNQQQNEIEIPKGVGRFNPNVSQEASSFFSKNFDKQEKFTKPKSTKEEDENENENENDYTISSISSVLHSSSQPQQQQQQQPQKQQQQQQIKGKEIESKSDFSEQLSSINSSLPHRDKNDAEEEKWKIEDNESSGDEFVLPVPPQYIEEQKKLIEREEKKKNKLRKLAESPKTPTESPSLPLQDKKSGSDEHSAHVVVLPHPGSAKKKRRLNNSSSKKALNDSSSFSDDGIDHEYEYYYSDDDKLGDSSCFSFHLRKMARPPKDISSSSFINSNSKSPIQSSSKIASAESTPKRELNEEQTAKEGQDKKADNAAVSVVSVVSVVDDNDGGDKSSSFSDEDFINSPQLLTKEAKEDDKSKTKINKNLIKTDNRIKKNDEKSNSNSKFTFSTENGDDESSNHDSSKIKKSLNPVSFEEVESSGFLFTSEQQKEKSNRQNSLDPIDSDVLFDDLSKISQKNGKENNNNKNEVNNNNNNRNSFACTIDDDSLIDSMSDDEDLSIIPKVSSASLSPNQRSEIALEDLEDIFNEEEEKGENKEVKKFNEIKLKKVVPEFEEEEEDVDDQDQSDGQKIVKNRFENENNRNSSSFISASQINGDRAFGQVKQINNASGNEVEGIIEAPSDFDF